MPIPPASPCPGLIRPGPGTLWRARRLLTWPAVKFEWLSRRAREIVSNTITQEGEPELERLLVAGAVVIREGEHYRIESGEDPWSELEARARRLEGLCECGALLSSHGTRAHCRRCGREYGKV